MNTQYIFAEIVVPFMSGMLAGTFARKITRFFTLLILLVVAGVAFAFVPVHEGIFSEIQSRGQQAIAAVHQIAVHVPATAMGGFLIGCFIDRLRKAR